MLIAYDRDEAGDRAAEKLGVQLTAAGLDAYRLQLPKGMDANEYALKVTPASKSLGLVIRKAQWLGKGEAPTARPSPTVVMPIPAVTEEATKEEISAPTAMAPATKAEDRRYRIRGLAKNLAFDVMMEVNVLIVATRPSMPGARGHTSSPSRRVRERWMRAATLHQRARAPR